MSDWVLPLLPLLSVDVEHDLVTKTEIYENPGGTEQRVSYYPAPRLRIPLRYDLLRDDVAAPAPWTPYSERGLVEWFLEQHNGPQDSFLLDLPGARKNLLAYSQDFSQAVWAAYYGKPAVTGGKTAPDGTATAQEFASADNAPANYSGVDQINSAAPAGPIAVSVWARCLSGTLAATLGTKDSSTSNITLTTAWQRFTHADAAWSPSDQGGRIFELWENVASNVAWQVWGAQAVPGSAAKLYVPTGASPLTGRLRVRFEEDSLRMRQVADQLWSAQFSVITVGS